MDKSKITINPAYQRYSYIPFDHPKEIRLLRVTREEETPEIIRCKFEHVSLDALSKPYVAISYVWGDNSPTHWARCPNNTFLEMPASSAAVLQRLLAANCTDYIWIDALCINQENNTAEKPDQIRLMRDIYSSAQYVFAWLGDASQDSKMALDFIPKIHHVIGYLYTSKQTITMESVTQFQDCALHGPMWKALINLVERPWFVRVWIIQEVVLAKRTELVCGNDSVDWQTLAVVVSMLQTNGLVRLLTDIEDTSRPSISWGFKGVQLAWGMRAARNEMNGVSLENALFGCAFYKASDDRDKLFALLGMCSEVDDEEFHPTYTDTKEVVYERFAQHLLTRDGACVDILYGAGIGFPGSISTLPSWVPDWKAFKPRTVFGQLASRIGYYASGASAKLTKVVYSQKAKSLTVQGRIIDEVKDLGKSMPPGKAGNTLQELKDNAINIITWYTSTAEIYPVGVKYPTGESFFPNVIARTLTANMTLQGTPASEQTLLAKFQAWLTTIGLMAIGAPGATSSEGTFAADQFMAASATAMGERPVLLSKRLYVGLTPPETIKGDVIALISGAATPFVLRRERDGYLIVGECYIHGLMQGQGVKFAEEEEIILF